MWSAAPALEPPAIVGGPPPLGALSSAAEREPLSVAPGVLRSPPPLAIQVGERDPVTGLVGPVELPRRGIDGQPTGLLTVAAPVLRSPPPWEPSRLA